MPANIATGSTGESMETWFRTIPLVTKVLTVGTLLSGAFLTFGVLSDHWFLFDYHSIVHKFQVWRLVVHFFYCGKFSFNFAMHTYILYENCKRYELNPFNTGGGGNTSDFLYMLIIGMVSLTLIAYTFEMYAMSEPLLYMIMYVWSRRDPDNMASVFGFKMKVLYLPWFYVAMRVVMGGSPTGCLIGMGVGHLYWFCIETVPDMFNKNPIQTPTFCINLHHWYAGEVSSGSPRSSSTAGVAPPAARQQQARPAAGPGGYSWGRGNTLGVR